MSEINDGGAAFPNVPDGAGDKWDDWDKGMTLRDYFAAKAMPVMIEYWFKTDLDDADEIAKTSYAMADAMLKAREC